MPKHFRFCVILQTFSLAGERALAEGSALAGIHGAALRRCRRLEGAGALQHPWARLAYAQALYADGDLQGCQDVLQAALQTYHVADKSEVTKPSLPPPRERAQCARTHGGAMLNGLHFRSGSA